MRVIYNGEVITGWRAWFAGAALFIAMAVGLVIAGLVLLGVTLTVAAVLIIVVPLAIVFAFVAAVMGGGQRPDRLPPR